MNALHSVDWIRAILGVALSVALLQGCALTRQIDSEVKATASTTQAPQQPATYKFDTLPSQALNTDTAQLQAMAAQALQSVGLTPETTTPKYTVMLGVQIIPFERDTVPHMHWSGFGTGLGVWRNGYGMSWRIPEYWWRIQVQFVLRDTHTQALVYDTTAIFDSPWGDTSRILPKVMQAALQDYPQGNGQVRRVVLPLPPEEEK